MQLQMHKLQEERERRKNDGEKQEKEPLRLVIQRKRKNLSLSFTALARVLRGRAQMEKPREERHGKNRLRRKERTHGRVHIFRGASIALGAKKKERNSSSYFQRVNRIRGRVARGSSIRKNEEKGQSGANKTVKLTNVSGTKPR